jgi:putative endonuclease
MHFVYILKSVKSGRHYIGETKNLRERFKRHNEGRSKPTKYGVPWEIEIACIVGNKSEGRKLEWKLKKLKNPRKAIEYVKRYHKVVVRNNVWLKG